LQSSIESVQGYASENSVARGPIVDERAKVSIIVRTSLPWRKNLISDSLGKGRQKSSLYRLPAGIISPMGRLIVDQIPLPGGSQKRIVSKA
jgi:hypothetical protein